MAGPEASSSWAASPFSFYFPWSSSTIYPIDSSLTQIPPRRLPSVRHPLPSSAGKEPVQADTFFPPRLLRNGLAWERHSEFGMLSKASTYRLIRCGRREQDGRGGEGVAGRRIATGRGVVPPPPSSMHACVLGQPGVAANTGADQAGDEAGSEAGENYVGRRSCGLWPEKRMEAPAAGKTLPAPAVS